MSVKLKLLPMVVAMLISVVMASTALSQSKMTTTERITFFKKKIKHDRDVLRFFKENHRLLSSSDPLTRLIATRQVKIHKRHLKWMLRDLSRFQQKISVNIYPPHHALWICIGQFEGSPTSVNPNGHYGMLQMHADWGYGTSHHASDDPQYVQEWAAEKAYRASHYARSFLVDQWLAYDGAWNCLRYA